MNNRKHTEETKAKISATMKERWANMSQEKREQHRQRCSQYHKLVSKVLKELLANNENKE